MSTEQYDVVIAGGGIAGTSAAAALSPLGLRILIVEPGIQSSRRLAGELIHPTGVAAFEELGLLPALCSDRQSELAGFAVQFGMEPEPLVARLRYGAGLAHARPALAMEHGIIRDRLVSCAASLPGVSVRVGSRITAVDVSNKNFAEVRVSSRTGEEVLRPRLLVGADGVSSPVSRLSGIPESRSRVSTLFGVLLDGVTVPSKGYGNIFLGGSGLILAYRVSATAVRVIFDVPGPHGRMNKITSGDERLQVLPDPFRSEVRDGLQSAEMIASASYTLTRSEVSRGRLALVGDAASCCHPLTATGMTACARDALNLRNSVVDANGDMDRALKLYARRRRASDRSRMILARALYEVFCAPTGEAKLMRDGLWGYWNKSSRNCATTMALLSTADTRLRVLLSELARVIVCGYGMRISQSSSDWVFTPNGMSLLAGLSRVFLRHGGAALK